MLPCRSAADGLDSLTGDAQLGCKSSDRCLGLGQYPVNFFMCELAGDAPASRIKWFASGLFSRGNHCPTLAAVSALIAPAHRPIDAGFGFKHESVAVTTARHVYGGGVDAIDLHEVR